MRPTLSALLASSLLLLPALSSTAQAPPPAAPTLQVYSRETNIDVSVLDASGKPVHDLKRSDFTILEDNRPIPTLSGFREHRSTDAPAPAPAAESLPPGTFTNQGKPESNLPLNILLLDDLDTPIGTQSTVHKQVADLIDKLAPGTRLAVFSLSGEGQLALVQGFTSDQQLLRKAVKSVKVQVAPLQDGGQDAISDMPADLTAPTTGKMAQPVRQQQAKVDPDIECNHASIREKATTGALTEIARYVSGMPGRKNLIWFTGLYPSAMRDKQGVICYDSRVDFRFAGELLGHSRVVLYPIDPRALDVLAGQGPDSRIGRIQTTEDLRMTNIADDSGGKAYAHTNDLTAAAAQALDYGSNYYAVTYIPPNQNMDTRQRHVSITVNQPNLTLIYRQNYHATAAGETVSGQTIQKATPLQTAMLRGALQPTQVLFHLNVASAPAADASLPPGNNADPKALKPPYRHLTLSYNIDTRDLGFDLESDGTYHGQFEYAVNVYNRDGNLLNSSVMAAKPTLPAAAYQSVLASGAKLRQEIAVPAKGDFTLRVAVHDLTTDRIGALEIPSSSITP